MTRTDEIMALVGGCPVCSGDCAGANPPVIVCPMTALRAAVEQEVGAKEGYRELCESAVKRAERAEAELAEARKDAERYRWLRDRFVGEAGIAGHIDISFDEVLHIHYSKAGAWPQGVDAAIDAAMGEKK